MVALPIIATDGEPVLPVEAHRLREDNEQGLRDVIVTQLVGLRLSAAAFALHEIERSVRSVEPPLPSTSPARRLAGDRRPLAAFDHRVLDVGVAGQTSQSNNLGRVASHRDREE